MPAFKPAYLIHGDDHGRIGERRARLRAVAEAESGSGGVELLEGDACSPEAVVTALSAMTFAMGRRFVIAVEKTVKGRDLPRWLQARAKECGFELELAAARALLAQVGDRQQRLQREVEKLALELGPGATAGVEEVEAACASSSERKAWTLADALVAGDVRTATRALLELREQGERMTGLLYGMVRRLRDALQVAEALAAGKPPAEIKRGLRMPPFAADRLIADVRERDVEAYRRALELMADLELETRGGGAAALSEETMAVRAVLAVAG